MSQDCDQSLRRIVITDFDRTLTSFAHNGTVNVSGCMSARSLLLTIVSMHACVFSAQNTNNFLSFVCQVSLHMRRIRCINQSEILISVCTEGDFVTDHMGGGSGSAGHDDEVHTSTYIDTNRRSLPHSAHSIIGCCETGSLSFTSSRSCRFGQVVERSGVLGPEYYERAQALRKQV